MRRRKHFSLVFLIALLLLCLTPIQPALAAKIATGGKVGNNITWSYSKHILNLGGEGELSLGLGSYEYPWESFKDDIQKVVIKEGVTRIPNGTFMEYPKLSTLSLPNSMIDFPLNAVLKTPWYKAQKKGVVYLNDIVCGYKGKLPVDYTLKIKDGTRAVATSAFDSQSTLKAVRLPESVEYIGENAFYFCENLRTLKLSNALKYIGGYAFAGTPWLQNQPTGMVYLGKVAYCYNGEMPLNTTIKIKKGVVSIAPVAFYGQENLTHVQLPETVTTIGYDAFHMTGIRTLYIPKTVTRIEGNKLGARRMKKVTVDQENPVYSSDDTGCLFNKKKTQMYEYPGINKTKIYHIPKTVKNVHALCFDGTEYLETLCIPASVTYVDPYAIHYSETLTAYKVSKKNPNYSSGAGGCLYNKDQTSLLRYPVGNKATSFTVPKQVKKIGQLAFLQAWNLETLKMYDNVTTIGSDAFYRCYSLENIRFSKNITRIEGQLFSYIPWVDKQPDGVIYIGKVAYAFRGEGKEVVIQNGIVSIADYAFAGWSSIKTVKIPKSVKLIGYGAFADSSGIKTIQINNPNCTIPMEKDTFPKKAVLYAASGSTTQTYAKKFGRMFVSL